MRMRLHALSLIAVTASVSGHSAAAAEPEQIPTITESQATEPGPTVALTPEQLERLRSLGYIR